MSLRHLLVGTALAVLSTPSYAAFVFTITESGSNVAVVGTGSIDTSPYGSPSGSFAGQPGLGAQTAFVFVGAANSPTVTYTTSLTGPILGSGQLVRRPTSGTGDVFGLEQGFNVIYVPTGYVSGTLLSGTSLFVGQSLQTIGLTAGTYSYRDNRNVLVATVNIGGTPAVPEPATWAMMIAGFGFVGAAMRRPKRAVSFA